jgi:chemotaxis protein MotB
MKTGIPPNRLAATGRGEYMPLDPNENEDAYRKNRRIEIKLTES